MTWEEAIDPQEYAEYLDNFSRYHDAVDCLDELLNELSSFDIKQFGNFNSKIDLLCEDGEIKIHFEYTDINTGRSVAYDFKNNDLGGLVDSILFEMLDALDKKQDENKDDNDSANIENWMNYAKRLEGRVDELTNENKELENKNNRLEVDLQNAKRRNEEIVNLQNRYKKLMSTWE